MSVDDNDKGSSSARTTKSPITSTNATGKESLTLLQAPLLVKPEETLPQSRSSNRAPNFGSRLMRWRNSKSAVIVVVALALFTDMVLYDMIVPILPTLLRGVGKDQSYVGVLFAIYAVGFLLATPTFGIWSDRFGDRKRPMILGQAGLAVATVLFAVAKSFWLLVIARLLQGIAAAISWTLGLALLADTVPENELGRAMGTVFGFNTLGYFVGPLIGGILTKVVSIETPFILCSALCVVDLAGRAFINPPPPPTIAAQGQQGKKVTLLRLFKYPEVPLIGLVVIFTSISFSAVETLLAAHLHDEYSLDVMGVSFCMMAIIVPSVIFSFFAGWLADRQDRYLMIFVSIIFYIFATPVLGFAPSLALFLIASVYFGATSSVLQAPTLPEMGAIVGRLGGGSYAQIYAILNVCYSMGMLVGPILASWLNDQIGFQWTMCLTALPFVLMIPFFLWLTIQSMRGTLKSIIEPLKPSQTNSKINDGDADDDDGLEE